ncbi:MAG: MurT ligase domain-containing protein [Acidimicrobiia bacterium]
MRDDVNVRDRAALVAGRAAGWSSRLTGRGAGTQVSGRVMLAIAPELLAHVARGRRVAIVSATNGKTTTTRLLADALRACGTDVVSNHTGANMPAGVAAALGRDLAAPTAILEVDERWVPKVVDPLGTELLVLGNLTRDQLDRFGEVRSIATRWRDVCDSHPDLAVVANASDPHVVWAVGAASHVTWVAVGAPWRSDAATCPECAALLTWTADSFRCDACGFGQPDAAYRLDGGALVTPTGRVELDLALPGDWNRMNAALALTAAIAHFGVDPARAVVGLRAVDVVSGRFSTVRLPDGREARVLLAKNPAGWTEVLRWLAPRASSVVLAVNAHVADGRDPSWLWDVPYELLRDKDVAASGERALDVAVRLDYGGVAHRLEADPVVAAAALPGDVHIVASYTQFTHLTRSSW